MSATLLLAATTSATASAAVNARANALPISFIAVPALGAGETGVIQVSPDNGTTWVNVISGGLTQQLSPNDTVVTVYGSGLYRVNKGASAGSTAIYVAAVTD